MGSYRRISVVVPVFNEEENIKKLVKRIDASLRESNYLYELIFIDDHSTDKTALIIENLRQKYPISLFLKKGKKGKAYSLLEGFSYTAYELVAMIDGDLQYPPEAIPEMIKKIDLGADIVVADRVERNTSLIRNITSGAFMYLFGKVLHGLSCDVQSGLKVFKKDLIDSIYITPTPWTFDLEFLAKARSLGYNIDTYPISFSSRKFGISKINLIQAISEIGLGAIKTKIQLLNNSQLLFSGKRKNTRHFVYNEAQYFPYTNLNILESAFFSMTTSQKWIFSVLIMLLIVEFALNWHTTLVIVIGVLTFLYFLDILFNFFLIYRSFSKQPELKVSENELKKFPKNAWPKYTILCPLYKEWHVLPQFIQAISNLDYPHARLQVLLLLEEDDTETIEKAKNIATPDYFEIVIVPHSYPKTKPKACNYGLLKAKGDYIVIYDAEDMPERTQLKKAVLSFKKLGNAVACVQAKLNFYNPRQNLLTKLFTAEYSLWFDLVLTGLQSINAPIPLGGTSNHFKSKYLKQLQGWDPFNVTEDCDLGIRLVKKGFSTAIFDSTTYEEANSEVVNWFWQRTRWIKGYMQTYLVHVRTLDEFSKNSSRLHVFLFQLIIGAKVLSMFINVGMWFITISYFLFRSNIGFFVESFFPTPVLYMGVFSLVFGNFLYLYYYMIGCAKRGYYDLIKYVFIVPVYWLAMSFAAWEATRRLIIQPHHWSKTKHGLHLQNVGMSEVKGKIAVNKKLEQNTNAGLIPNYYESK